MTYSLVQSSITLASVAQDGSITFGTGAGFVIFKAGQIIIADETESLIAFDCDTRTSPTTPLPNYVILAPLGYAPTQTERDSSTLTGGVAGFTKAAGAAISVIGVTTTLVQAATSRLAMQIKGKQVRYFQDANDYSTAPILGTQSVPLVGQYNLFVAHQTVSTETAKILRPAITRPTPSCFYSADDQIHDFGSTQANPPGIHIKVYQVSALVGRGDAGDATV